MKLNKQKLEERIEQIYKIHEAVSVPTNPNNDKMLILSEIRKRMLEAEANAIETILESIED